MHKRLSGFGVGIAFLLATALSSPTVVSQGPAIGLEHGSVTISRDEHGVPHVTGSTLEAVWFGVGYAQGQDRLWQAELLRRSATGTSAEVLGSSAVDGDVLARTLFGPRSSNPSEWRQKAAQIVWTPLGIGRVPNTIWMNRGTYNQLVHLGIGPKLFGFNVVAPGQSGVPSSVHFSDQLEMYATWRYKPMRLDREQLHRDAESSITLHADPQ